MVCTDIFFRTQYICVLGYKRDLCSNWVKFIQIQFIYTYDKKQIEMPTQITISSNRPTIFFSIQCYHGTLWVELKKDHIYLQP